MNIIEVKNLITQEIGTYYNGYDLETNLISTIVCQEDANKLLNDEFREKITEKAKVERISSKNGQEILYSEPYDLIAYKTNRLTDED
tara:strand:+ start:61 stop:321 length:261 start_codon:yes stop_codon:yes gene_type:complete